MPKLTANKKYPSLVDFYYSVTKQNPITGQLEIYWVYNLPITMRCDFMSLSGHGEQYSSRGLFEEVDDLRLEVSPQDAKRLKTTMRFGNMRNANETNEEYYEFVGGSVDRVGYYFNVRGMHPKVDANGHTLFVEVLGKLAENA